MLCWVRVRVQAGVGREWDEGAEGRHRHSAADPWLVHRATREALSEWSCRGIATQLTDPWLVRWATRRLLVSGRVGGGVLGYRKGLGSRAHPRPLSV